MSTKFGRNLKGIGLCAFLFLFSGMVDGQGDSGSKPRYLGRTTEDWIGELAGGKARHRTAFDALAEPRREATPVLLEMIVHENASIRCLAAMGLWHIGSEAPEAIPSLIKAVQDRDLNTRYWAAQALGKHGPAAQAAVPALVKVLQKTFRDVDPTLEGPERYYADARAVAAESLGKIGKDAASAIPALKEALKDRSSAVREAAANALVQIEGEGKK